MNIGVVIVQREREIGRSDRGRGASKRVSSGSS